MGEGDEKPEKDALALREGFDPNEPVGITFVIRDWSRSANGHVEEDMEAHADWHRLRTWELGLYGHVHVTKDCVNGAMNGRSGACQTFANELRALVGTRVDVKAVRPFSGLNTMLCVACSIEEIVELPALDYLPEEAPLALEDEDPALADWHPPLASVYVCQVEVATSEATCA